MSTWCDSCSFASACHKPISRVPDVGEAQAIVRCSDEAAAVNVADTTSKEAAVTQFGADSVEFI